MAEAGQLDLAPRRLISRADFARKHGVSRAAVTIAVSAGRLTGPALAPKKKLVLPFADEQWERNRGGEDGAAIARQEADDDLDTEDEAVDAVSSTTPPQPGSIAYEKALALQLKNQRTKREMEVEDGALVSTAEVGMALAAAGGAIARDIDNIASWADELAALPCGDVPKIRAYLKTRSRDLRDAIATRLTKLSIDPAAAEVSDGDDDSDE